MRYVNILLMVVFSSALLLWSNDSIAQNCGDGYVQEGGQGYMFCVPIENYYSPANGPSIENPGPQWSSRWGAIALDPAAGHFGGREGLNSKRKAEKAAIKECKKNGGISCKIVATYSNQCGAMAWGNNFSVSWRGPDRDETIKNAVEACSKQAGSCEPYYAGCSFPVKIR
jgi:Domain of unknown function (DUF4189)